MIPYDTLYYALAAEADRKARRQMFTNLWRRLTGRSIEKTSAERRQEAFWEACDREHQS